MIPELWPEIMLALTETSFYNERLFLRVEPLLLVNRGRRKKRVVGASG